MSLALLFESAPGFLLFLLCILSIQKFAKTGWNYRWFMIHLFVVCCIEISAMILNRYSISNTFLFHFYVIEEFTFISLFYRQWFQGISKRRSIDIGIVVFIVFSITNTIWIQEDQVFNSNARVIESIVLAGFAIATFQNLLASPEHIQFVDMPVFWINAANLLYFSTGLFLFLLSNTLLKKTSNSFNHFVWDFHRWLAIFYYLLIGTGLWKIRTAQK